MNSTEISKLALKIFAIYIIVQVLLSIPQFFQAYVMLSNGTEPNSDKWFILIAAASVIALFSLSLLIWKLSNNTKAVLSKNSDNSIPYISEEFILSILGIYLIVYGLTRTIVVATSAYYSLSSNDINYELTQGVIYVITYLLTALLGLSFIVRSKGWSILLNKLRTAAT